MSALNPYEFDDELDADLFENAPPKHVLDGTICPSCGVAHDASGVGGEKIASALLDSMPEDLADSLVKSLPIKSDIIDASALTKSLYGVVSNLDGFRPEAAELSALMYVVNEMTGGRVSALAEFFETERCLISTIFIRRRVTQLIDHAKLGTDGYNNVSYNLALLWQDYLTERARMLSESYLQKGEGLDIEIDYRLAHEHIPNIDRTKGLVKFFRFDELGLGTSEILNPTVEEQKTEEL